MCSDRRPWRGSRGTGRPWSSSVAMLPPCLAEGGEQQGRKRECRGRERQWRPFQVFSTRPRRAGGHANSDGERGQHAASRLCALSALLPLLKEGNKFNTTSNIPLKPDFYPSISPKPLSFGTICSNKSCRAMRYLQLFLKCQSLIQPGWRDTRLRSGVHEN